jgi:hypothetical protein
MGKVGFDVFAEAVRRDVVKASSDAALLETLIFPMIRQQRLWDHYPAVLHGLWAAVWSSFYMTLCRLFEYKDDSRTASVANLLRRLLNGDRPAMEPPARWEAERSEFLSRVPAWLDEIKSIDSRLAFLRSGYLAHRDVTKAADHEKAQIDFSTLNSFLSLSQKIADDYLLVFRDESQSWTPTNYPIESRQFLRWSRLEDYAEHHAAWADADHKRMLKDHGLS